MGLLGQLVEPKPGQGGGALGRDQHVGIDEEVVERGPAVWILEVELYDLHPLVQLVVPGRRYGRDGVTGGRLYLHHLRAQLGKSCDGQGGRAG